MNKVYVVSVDEVDDDGIVEEETVIVGVYTEMAQAERVMDLINQSDLPLLAEIEEWVVDQEPVIPDVLGEEEEEDDTDD